jgi:hypothetical protein
MTNHLTNPRPTTTVLSYLPALSLRYYYYFCPGV